MEGKYLTVSVGKLEPYINLKYVNGKARLQGLFGAIWKLLQKRLKFTSELIYEDFTDGVFYFQNGHRNVLLYPSVSSSENAESFDFTIQLLSRWYWLYIKDSTEANSAVSFIRNWSTGLWLCTAFTVLVFTVFLYLMLNISFRVLHVDIINRIGSWEEGQFRLHASIKNKLIGYYKLKSSDEASFGNCFIIAFAAFCSQGCNLSTRLISVRMLVLTFLIFALIMSNSYSALLVSQLTLRERFLPFTRLDEIPEEASDYSLCVREDSLPYKFFKINDTSTALKKEWRNIVNKKPCVNGFIPAEVMCAPKMAFLEDPALIHESISKNTKCKVAHLKGAYYKTELTILLKGIEAQTRMKINSEILRYREVGILKHLIKRSLRTDDLTSPAEDPVLQVTYDHMKGVLAVYSIFIGFSFAILVFEIIYAQLKRRFGFKGCPCQIFRSPSPTVKDGMIGSGWGEDGEYTEML